LRHAISFSLFLSLSLSLSLFLSLSLSPSPSLSLSLPLSPDAGSRETARETARRFAPCDPLRPMPSLYTGLSASHFTPGWTLYGTLYTGLDTLHQKGRFRLGTLLLRHFTPGWTLYTGLDTLHRKGRFRLGTLLLRHFTPGLTLYTGLDTLHQRGGFRLGTLFAIRYARRRHARAINCSTAGATASQHVTPHAQYHSARVVHQLSLCECE
jgi:hypothetical protein